MENNEENQSLNHTKKQEMTTNNTDEEQQEKTLDNELSNADTVKEKPKKSKKGSSGFFGGIVGGIIPAIIVVLLFTSNIIPLDSSNNSSSQGSSESNTPDIVKTMSTEGADVSTNIEETSEAVVGVINLQKQSVWTQSEEAGTGSGIIYKKENGKAYVVTNQHVVEDAQEVEIVLNDDERVQAQVLGTDELTDLAVLEVNGEKIDTVANIGSSENLKVGKTVIAIGNPLGMNFANTVTKGIVSGLNRSVSIDTNGDRQPDWITEVIQTDAAINPGNSGGALVNNNGEVIGINSMKIARQEVEGIGFAIPMDSALPIMEQLEKNGEIERPLIGISTASLNQVPPQFRSEISLPEEVKGGMVIAEVQSGSSADAAGLQQFDVITKINGNEITSILELRKYLYSETAIGETIEIEFYRDGKIQTADLELQARE
ncbi:serine protease [Virgibacillus profundi]|uniref:Serine protease n=1 Tax=Virgibacillus profundi TaxID=2024555 RepID=A0A2A2IHL9_9BACI|nr:trypsin-like peptidase domain-containing protein [Virgibacillus profundi]PAV30640.1 serine protease [Virgibacillus profundi]PXY54812.1 PDZ domain-containing protein [Virgibacillus profundi]